MAAQRGSPQRADGTAALLIEGIPEALRLKIHFDAGVIDQMIERLLVLRAQMLPAPLAPAKRN